MTINVTIEPCGVRQDIKLDECQFVRLLETIIRMNTWLPTQRTFIKTIGGPRYPIQVTDVVHVMGVSPIIVMGMLDHVMGVSPDGEDLIFKLDQVEYLEIINDVTTRYHNDMIAELATDCREFIRESTHILA